MKLWDMSLSGAVMILATVVIRALAVNRLPKRAFLALWGVALARLLVPYSLPSAWSVYSLLDRLAPPVETAPAAVFTAIAPVSAAPPPHVGCAVPSAAVHVDPWASVWLLGTLVCGAFFAGAYLKYLAEFRTSLPVGCEYARLWLDGHRIRRPIEIRQSDRISAPLTYGVLRPVILMPASTDWSGAGTLRYVLEHEYVHIRRFDAVTKPVLAAAVCLHWFNPAVWIMYVLANRDIELSCDEAVLRRFGEREKSAYAMALIRMEEARSGIPPLWSSFSKNAVEERIVAIMKIKKTSLAAMLTAAALVVGTTAVFATSAQAEDSHNYTSDMAGTSTQVTTVVTSGSPNDGAVWYIIDNGGTFETLIQEEYDARFPTPRVEWWTYDEYKAWLEKEKVGLQDMIGEKGWTGGRGEFVWTQEIVDETIEMYEGILEDIKNGMLYSKSVDGDPDGMVISVNPADMDAVYDIGIATGGVSDFEKELLREYSAFGLTFDARSSSLWFEGEPVRYFYDGVDIDNGTAVAYEFVNEKGTVDVHTVRKAVQNPDGSVDPMGELAGLERYSQEEFDSREIPGFYGSSNAVTDVGAGTAEAVTFVSEASPAPPGLTFAEIFEKYAAFGITYGENEGSGGAGRVYLNGSPVGSFVDISPDGSVFSLVPQGTAGGIKVQTVYDADGNLTGVSES